MPAYEEMLMLLHDGSFAKLRLQASREPLTWNQFCRMDMPYDYSKEETWRLLSAIRHQTASILDWKSYQRNGDELWYVTTESMMADLSEIESKSMDYGTLNGIAKENNMRELYASEIAAELTIAIERDGGHIDADAVLKIVEGAHDCETETEHAVQNTIEILDRLDTYRDRPLDIALLYDFYNQIARQTGGCLPTPLARGMGITDHTFDDPSRAITQILRAYNEGWAVGRQTHPLLFLLTATSILWDFHPFPAWNALMEVVLRNLFFMRKGYAVLTFLPIGKCLYRWEQGLIAPPDVYTVWAEEEPDCDEGLDCTAQFASYIRLIVRELRRFENTALRVRDRNARLIERIDGSKQINHRQKQICRQALKTPGYEFVIEEHQKACQIAYATARRDLLGLVKMGLLDYSVHDKAFVFHASRSFNKDLESLL